LWDLFTKNLQIKKNIKNNFIKKKNLLKNRNLTNLKIGQRIGLSGNELKKIRQGKIKIEKKIDLHGYTELQAKERLEKFIELCINQDIRSILVITGKGHGKNQGVIKKNISYWLNNKNLRSKILAFDYAAPKHGGTGAMYVFLKKFT